MFGKAGTQWLRAQEMSELDRLFLENHLSLVESINVQICRVDEAIRERASQDEGVRLLLRSEIGSITRFADYKRLVSWAGLAPSVCQSGSVEFHDRITKRGSSILRWALVEAARVAVQHDERMRVFHERVAVRRGD